MYVLCLLVCTPIGVVYNLLRSIIPSKFTCNFSFHVYYTHKESNYKMFLLLVSLNKYDVLLTKGKYCKKYHLCLLYSVKHIEIVMFISKYCWFKSSTKKYNNNYFVLFLYRPYTTLGILQYYCMNLHILFTIRPFCYRKNG